MKHNRPRKIGKRIVWNQYPDGTYYVWLLSTKQFNPNGLGKELWRATFKFEIRRLR